MKKVLLVLLLTGCATQPPPLTEAQIAIRVYFIEQCVKEGVTGEQAILGCMATKLIQADAAYRAGGGYQQSNIGNVLQGMGQAITPQRPAMQCESYRDLAGVTRTTCR